MGFYNHKMDQLIPIINELQDTYSKLNMPFIDLPQIVIIGSQSAGKSSVLENIVKHEFLPRGTGIVTRCPLVLHLVYEADRSKGTRGRFLHTGDCDFYDFEEIKEEIIRQTEILAGPEKNISDQPITLKIYSHEFPNLTLIDLPGLTKVAVESQPKDIDVQIRNTCLRYARKENSIILAISAANVDLANSDSLRFAEELDPEGKRTLCVITKLDLMDKGTNARDILTGKVLPKELGYIGVVSRSQEDIYNRKPIEESLMYEKKFFETNYPDLALSNGTGVLTHSLNRLLKKHIKKCLPTLKDTIKDKIYEANCKLQLLGVEVDDKKMLIPRFLSSFETAYVDINDGNFEQNLNEIRGGALIADIIYDQFQKNLMAIDIEGYLTDNVIKAAIRNTCGSDKMSFSRQKPFISLIREQIQKLLPPSLKCIDNVYEMMREFVNEASLAFPHQNFPNLVKKILNETHILIEQSFKETKSLVVNLITSEKVDVMCSHPNYQLGFALQNMNVQNNRENGCAQNNAADLTLKDHLLGSGFKNICQNINANFVDFSRMLIYYIENVGQVMNIYTLLKNKELTNDQKTQMLQEIFDNHFQPFPDIIAQRDIIIYAMLDDTLKFKDDLIQYELDCQLTKLSELKSPPNEKNEYVILKNLVIEYFNMVRQNVCYYVPKLIKAFLVIHVRQTLINHLQMIYLEPNLDFLLQESDDICLKRKHCRELLVDLENVKRSIDEIYCDQR